jgi:class 3 adenylate cyclase
MEPPNEQHTAQMKIAHVLFTDIVSYSKLPIDQQTSVLKTLQEIVRGTAEVARAQKSDQLISIATGDGMALVFFNDPMAPVQCALEISRALKGYPEIQLRMGVHSGPVNQVIDVNDRVNVAGTGINIAQRIMDSGDAGHILLSRRVAEDLGQYSTWQPLLHDLEEIEVKHGVRVHVFNLYTDEVGNAALPEKIKKRKTRGLAVPVIALATLLLLVAGGLFLLHRKGEKSGLDAMRADSEFVTLLQRKAGSWIESIISAQAASGGFKSSPSGAETTVQTWTTAQCLTAILSAQKNLDGYLPKIKSAFEYIQKLRRTAPDEGWNLYGNQNIYTVTEINGWVTVAHVKSLESKTMIWNDAERQEVLNRIIRDLDELGRRQEATGGWRPIREEGADFTRTYSTVIALWSLVEARKSPVAFGRMGTRYDESIRGGINWLLRTYKTGQGWVQNPDRTGQQNRFDGLTAHALFVLSQAATLPEFAYLKNDQTYRDARKDFLNNKELSTRSIEKENSSIPDVDVGFDNTEFMAEGSTFLWFPWTLLELTQLASDESLTAEEREAATRLRREILNNNFARLETYVESANLTYFTAENLFCVSQYLSAMESGAPADH